MNLQKQIYKIVDVQILNEKILSIIQNQILKQPPPVILQILITKVNVYVSILQMGLVTNIMVFLKTHFLN